MTITVSISQFRRRLSDYIDKARNGSTVVVRDEKTDQDLVQVTGRKQWDPEAFRRTLYRVAGSISVKDHPEWATPSKISRWLRKERKAAEGHFDVPPRH